MKEEQEMLDWAMHAKETEALLGNRKKLGELLSAPETKKLMELLEKRSGGNLRSAAQSAAKAWRAIRWTRRVVTIDNFFSSFFADIRRGVRPAGCRKPLKTTVPPQSGWDGCLILLYWGLRM